MDRLKRIDVRDRLVAQALEIFAALSHPELAAMAGVLLDRLSTPEILALVSRLRALGSGRGTIPPPPAGLGPAIAKLEKKRFFPLTQGNLFAILYQPAN